MTMTTRWALGPGFLCALLVAGVSQAGCGDDDEPRDAAVDGALDAGADGSTDAAVPDPPCRTPLVTGEVFALDPDGDDTQIHVNAQFDGESVWVVYNKPDPSGGFDVYGVRLDCDGTARVPPFRINTTDHNDVDPTLVVSGDRMLVAWQTDTGTGVNNMQLPYRVYGVDGQAVMSADSLLRTTRGGQPVPGNTWLPEVAALPNGFAIAGARALEDASGLQAFVQRLDDDGGLDGATLDASFFPVSSQSYPTLAAAPDGTLYLAFAQALPPDYDDAVYYTALAPGATQASPLPAVLADQRAAAAGPDLARGPDGQVYLAFGDADAEMIVLTDGADFTGGPAVELGTPNRLDFSPAVAPATGGGAVAWFRNLSGFQNELRVQGFTYNGTAFTLGEAQNVTAESVPPYAPTITHIKDDIYFVAWSQGDNPDYRAMGMFLQIP